jgi:hypothetical protein
LQRKPELLFLPSRKELTEVTRLRNWESAAVDRFGAFCDTPRIRREYGNVATYLRKAAVPYVPYFAYGEELAAKTDKGLELAESFAPLIQLLFAQEVSTQAPQPVAGQSMTARASLLDWLLNALSFIVGLGLLGLAVWGLPKLWHFLSAQVFGTWGPWGLGGFAGAMAGSVGWAARTFSPPAKERIDGLGSPRFLVAAGAVALIGGGLGAAAAGLLSDSRYYLIASIGVGFAVGPIMQAVGRLFSPGESKKTSGKRDSYS